MAEHFDVVVVGAGSGGAVVASRLAEQPGVSVLLLEAGPDHRVSATPHGISGPSFHLALREPGRQWADLMATRSAGQPPRPYLRGRGVGGCSAVNAMVGLRGVAADYDEWGVVFGADGWSAAEAQRWWPRVAERTPLHPAPTHERGPLGAALMAADIGAVAAPLTRTADGRRVSVNDAYIEPARSSGLHVRGDSLVNRVLFNGRRAAGVRLADGSEIEAGTVVVSAGAIHSPAILLRSGVDRPGVGQGLQDHPSLPIVVRLRNPPEVRRDRLALSVILQASWREQLDLQVLAIDALDPDDPHLAALMPAVMRVESRGWVTLRSADPAVHPQVEFNLLHDEADRDALRAAVRVAEEALATSALRAAVEVLPYRTDDEGLRSGVGDYVHATSTCRMGSDDDPKAVVDGACRVIGYDGLLVCDASVLPRVPRANTHLPVTMVAERTAALLSERLSAG
ncbi:MAG TPA: glucose-methanol-choline oxidoreductase [Acidimicrobiaceae bacterium]|nr:glucose-methanol-choline oxidoreductase [Acidimicrobiaceae bacterium]